MARYQQSELESKIEALRARTESDNALDCYFDTTFATQFERVTGRQDIHTLGIIRTQAETFMREGRYKGQRYRLAQCTRDACNAIICGFSSQLTGDSVSKYDAADVIARWNLAWAYGALVARVTPLPDESR